MSLGLEHGINRVVPYSSDWPIQYVRESEKIKRVCTVRILGMEHVGSTAVPGLISKPIIDIAVGVARLSVAETMKADMASIGYDYPGDVGIPDDRIFGRDKPVRHFLVHVVEYDGAKWHQYLQFRNALRSQPQLAAEYGRLKTHIVEQHPTGRAAYAEQKTDFVNKVLSGSN